ncbi:MAG: bacterial transcriptional activator domain-containing protein, partial [Anaerolineae bacterium]|nr:bacterial transcriptional activator domain-containing protein [Anaerolineae bacterium]
MTCRLTISLLGPFQARWDGQPIVFRSDTMRALLAYLALEAGALHRRESLAALLWPDHESVTALTNLRQTLSRLARAIGNSSVRPAFLRIDARTVRFDANSDCQLDVHTFEERIAQAQTHRHRRVEVCLPCVQSLRQATILYRGEFLSGLSLDGAPEFEQWTLVQREHFHTQALSALSVLAAHYAQRGEWEEAYQHALHQVELEPWHEPAHRQIMQALAATGRRGAALAQYENCRRILLENLDVEPEEATRALYAEIQVAESGDRLPVQATPAPYDASPCDSPSRHMTTHNLPVGNLPARTTLFVGREAELVQVNEWLAGPDDRLITLTGLGGSGKTRLA